MNKSEVAAYLRVRGVNRTPITDRGVLRSVNPDGLSRYLQSKGWKRRESQHNRVAIYDLETYVVLVPLSDKYVDYHLRIAEIIETLAKVEGRYEFEVLGDFYPF